MWMLDTHLAAASAAVTDTQACGPGSLFDKNFCSVLAAQPLTLLLLHLHMKMESLTL